MPNQLFAYPYRRTCLLGVVLFGLVTMLLLRALHSPAAPRPQRRCRSRAEAARARAGAEQGC